MKTSLFPVLFSTSLLFAPATVPAAQVYVAAGFPGLLVGVAQPVSPSFTVRADWGGIASRGEARTEEGITYDVDGSLNRLGVFADWFALGNGFRFTGGLTLNNYGFDLASIPAGGTIQIGNQTYPVAAGDRFDVEVSFARLTPYVGIGWGHHRLNSSGQGWSFVADLGVSIGKAKVNAVAGGNLANQPGLQASIDEELAELRDGIGAIRAIPQMTIGVGYSF